ncbi:T9SS type A sorting domain-containing protein [Hymenobacter terricola]|uniref:T9SS type A sorting domain-containing protein n=1 Tax=Hymenobacter terricola TaxID=2819236 RepID=UPI001B3125AB|nr:T9SS type A sorting domain-containing protein [Hymenobacter terricola]
MKKLVLTALMAVATVAAASSAQAQTVCPTAPTPITVDGVRITTNTTWTSNNIYLLKNFVFVESGATLTIQPGTIIKGDLATKGTLTIKQGGRIDARGTATQPIVFTSNQPAGSRARGDWGGVILLGRATQNIPATPTAPLPSIEGGLPVADGVFGGTDDADNSGIMQYVRIEFPGVAYSTDNEINGLTLGGVGNGTTLDHIQVSYSGDDSFEWFGGSVNAKYLITYRGIDDEWDTDNGFHGKVQFGVALRDPNVADQSGSNGFESDNDALGSNNSPQTSAVFSNMSNFIAPGTLNSNYKRGMHIRRNSALSVFNSVLTSYPVGLLLDEGTAPFSATNSAVNAANGSLKLQNNVLASFARGSVATRVNGSTYNVKQFLGATNDTTSTVASLLLNANNFTLGSPNFVPQAATPLATGAAFTDAKLAGTFFTPVTYRGAFAPAGTPNADWTAGWTTFDPQNFCYNRAGVVTAARVKAEQSLQMGVYPNPSAGTASLSFALPHASATTVRVFDATGRLVATVADARKLTAGTQLLALPAGLQAGIYIVTITTTETAESVRFVVAK